MHTCFGSFRYLCHGILFTVLNVTSESIWSPQEGREKGPERSEGKTALELMKQEQAQNAIVTFSAQIDEMLGKDIFVMYR